MKNLSVILCAIILTYCSAATAAQAPRLQPDGAWIAVSGTVENATLNTFLLDYGEGTILVRMDDWDLYDETAELREGFNVTVSGEVSHQLFSDTAIDADTVYVENTGTYYYASGDATARGIVDVNPRTPVVIGDVAFTGTVSSVADDRFVINTGAKQLTVTTAAMPYDPTDDQGFQQLDAGDVVSVYGSMSTGVIGARELAANAVVTLHDSAPGAGRP